MAPLNSHSVSHLWIVPSSLTQDLAVRFVQSVEQLSRRGRRASQTWTGSIVEFAFAFSGVSLHDSVHRHLFGTEEGHEMGCLIYFYQVSFREPGANPGLSAMLASDQTELLNASSYRDLEYFLPYTQSGRGRPTGKDKTLLQIKLRSKRVTLGLSPERIGVLVVPWQLEVREPAMALSIYDFCPWPLPQLSRWTEDQGHRVCNKQSPEGPSPRPCTSTLGLTVQLSLQSWGGPLKI